MPVAKNPVASMYPTDSGIAAAATAVETGTPSLVIRKTKTLSRTPSPLMDTGSRDKIELIAIAPNKNKKGTLTFRLAKANHEMAVKPPQIASVSKRLPPNRFRWW